MTKKYKMVLVAGVIVLLGTITFVLLKKYYFDPTLSNGSMATTTNTIPVGVENPTIINPHLKTYRNEEWGFEFEYPAELSIKEKVFGGYYSQFNLVLFKHIDESRDWAIIVNVVTPKFVDTAFWKSQENVSKVIIDGVEGARYEYQYEGSPHTSFILPLGDLKLIVGTGDGSYAYNNELDKVVSSFRFIEK